ncbi:MAG: glycerophosphodiester phosphodiesterase family protein [Pseudomonadota bacterium]
MTMTPLIVAHRGGILDHGKISSNCGPENTLIAFQRAAALGAEHVELDVRLTKDNEVVILHDTTLQRTAKKHPTMSELMGNILTGNIASYTWEELQKYSDMRGSWSEEFCPQRQPVPSLQQVLEIWPALKSIQLEVKIEEQNVEYQHTLLRRLNEITSNYPKLESIITSSSLALLYEAKIMSPSIQRGYVSTTRPKNYDELKKQYELNYLIPNHKWLTKDDVETAKSSGMKTSVWTVNNTLYLEKTKDWNIWSVITDDPMLFFKIETPNTIISKL